MYRGTTSGGEAATPIATGLTSATYTDTGVSPGSYYYEVTAVNQYGESPRSNEASATILGNTASFVGTDSTTQGSWKGVYGADGYNIFQDTSTGNPSYPSYATVSVSGNTAFTWASSTFDGRALSKAAAGSVDRIAGAYYSTTSESFDINLTDGNTHQVAFYLLGWGSNARNETIAITDANSGATLDSQSASNFQNGVYYVWNISGHVKVTLTFSAGPNAIASALFFGAGSGSTVPAPATSLTATAGTGQVGLSWTGSTGATSYNVYRGTAAGGESATPIATGLTGTSYTDTSVINGTTYYYEVVAVNAVGGSGASNEASAKPTSPAATATFVTTDTTTQGSWKGVYGADGYNIFQDTSTGNPSYPSYATVSVSGNTAFTWTTSTFDGRALSKAAAGSVDRMAGAYYSNTSESFDINLTDNNAHQVAFYLLGWGSNSRNETIAITDANSGASLDSRSASNFQNGVYYVWNIKGHVKVTITISSGGNAIASALFFGAGSGSTVPAAATSLTATAGTGQIGLSWTGSTGATSYNIYRGTTAGGEGTTAYQTSVTGTSYTDTSVTNGTTYYYQVVAVNAVGGSPASNEASASALAAPSAPTKLVATPGNGQAALSWTGSTGATSYNVYRGTSAGGEAATPIASGITSTTYTDPSLTNGTTYYYEVTAVNSIGESGKSNEASATPTSTAATFVTTDTTTQGSWKGVYGADGYNIFQDTSTGNPKYPSYATVSVSGNTAFTWAASTFDGRALSKAAAGSVDRIAGAYYSTTSESFDINLTDGNTHQVAFYLLGWGSNARNETIAITDANSGATLDSRSASSFQNGVYYVWNISGHVKVTLTLSAGPNAIASALFFGAGSGSTVPAPATSLTATAGSGQVGLSWTGSTGATSYNVYRGTTAGGESTTAIATGLTGTSYTDTGVTGGTTYYYEVVAVNATGGSGASNEANAKPTTQAAAATFVTTDTTTQGSWKGVYGADGYNIFQDTSTGNPSYPSYATVNVTGNTAFTWAASSFDGRALSKAAAGSVDRIAGAYYSTTSESFDINLTDGNTHQVAFYLLGWGSNSRNETIAITDANSGTSLDTRSASNFQNGVYYVWNIKGHVKVTITLSSGNNAIASALFFGAGSGSTVPAAATNLSATAGTGQVALSWTGSTGASSYNVYRGTTAGGESTTAIATGVTSTTYTDTSVTAGTTYYYEVVAVNATGGSGASNEASAKP